MESRIDLSVCIVSWNVAKLLEACLESVRQESQTCALEVIVVDNASHDNSPQMVHQKFPEARLIQNPTNAGFPEACNQAMAIAQGRYLLMLNPDTVVQRRAFQKMIQFMDEHPGCGALGPKLLNSDRTLQPSCRSFPTLETQFYSIFGLDQLFKNNQRFGKYMLSWWDHSDTREVDQPMGSALLLRQETIQQVGPFDEAIWFWYDEVDLCYRIKKAGWKIYFYPGAEIIHYGGQGFRQWKSLKQILVGAYTWRKSRNYFFRKHYHSLSVLPLIALDLLQIGLGLFVLGVLIGIPLWLIYRSLS